MQQVSEQFAVGDKVVCAPHGVTEVVSIEEKGRAGRVYVLQILGTEAKVSVPVSTAKDSLRPPISPPDVPELFAILQEQTLTFDSQTWNRRHRGFMDKIKTPSLFDVAEVVRDLYRRRLSKSLSSGEERMLKTARGLIVKELSVSLGKPEDHILAEIEQIFEVN